jgi:leader peptidase (prepilin peptidase) / N-methyltransferase
MELALCAAGSGLGLAFGSVAAGFQHLLYRNAEHRENPASGRKLLVMRVLLGLACAAVIALALRPNHYDAGPALLTAAFGVVLLVIASTDFERRIIPNRLSYPAIVAAILFCWAWPDRSVADVAIGGGVALGIGALLFVVGLFVGGGAGGALGLGDVKLALLIGLIVGWPLVTTALIFGVVIAGVPALVLMLAGKGKGYFSYGPYLVAGALIVMLWPGRFL